MVPGPGQAPIGYVAVSPPHGQHGVPQAYGAPYPVQYGYPQQGYDEHGFRRSESYSGVFQQQGGEGAGSVDGVSRKESSSSGGKGSKRKKNKNHGSNTSINSTTSDKHASTKARPSSRATLSTSESTQSLPDVGKSDEPTKKETVSWAHMNAADDEVAPSDAMGSQSSLPSSSDGRTPKITRASSHTSGDQVEPLVSHVSDNRTPPPSPRMSAPESTLVPESLNSKRVYVSRTVCLVPPCQCILILVCRAPTITHRAGMSALLEQV
jgi:hypothetical protein